jgi:hypothetical protein
LIRNDASGIQELSKHLKKSLAVWLFKCYSFLSVSLASIFLDNINRTIIKEYIDKAGSCCRPINMISNPTYHQESNKLLTRLYFTKEKKRIIPKMEKEEEESSFFL